MMSNEDRALAQHIRSVALRAGAERYALSKRVTMRIPVTDPFHVLSVAEAVHDLFMETAGYYLEHDDSMTREISAQLVALHVSVYDKSKQVSALKDAVIYFAHSQASAKSSAVQEAIKSAQLALLYDGSDDGDYGTESTRWWTLSS